jgi:hypothetical protein
VAVMTGPAVKKVKSIRVTNNTFMVSSVKAAKVNPISMKNGHHISSGIPIASRFLALRLLSDNCASAR